MNWFVLIFCLTASFLVSGTEAGILSLNRLRLRHLAHQKDRAAVQLQQLLERPARLLVTALVITSLLHIVALVLLVNILVGWFGWAGYFLTFVLACRYFFSWWSFCRRRFFDVSPIGSWRLWLSSWMLRPRF